MVAALIINMHAEPSSERLTSGCKASDAGHSIGCCRSEASAGADAAAVGAGDGRLHRPQREQRQRREGVGVGYEARVVGQSWGTRPAFRQPGGERSTDDDAACALRAPPAGELVMQARPGDAGGGQRPFSVVGARDGTAECKESVGLTSGPRTIDRADPSVRLPSPGRTRREMLAQYIQHPICCCRRSE
jgi:hypothetical protein